MKIAVLSVLIILNICSPMNDMKPSENAILSVTEWSLNEGSYKCYMDYRAITSTSSPQWQLQQGAWTDENGLRRVEDRYCVALGSHFGSIIGAYYTIELETGEQLRCILADQKADRDTDERNIADQNGAVVEFVVDAPCLPGEVTRMGDISYIKGFHGKVRSIYREER